MSREEILKKLNSLHHKILNTSFAEKVSEAEMLALVDAKEILKEQPKADWIPCEERLPDEEGFYLVSVGAPYKPIRVYMYKKVGDEFKWFDGSVTYALLPHFVEAWQPLPQPYKKEGAE